MIVSDFQLPTLKISSNLDDIVLGSSTSLNSISFFLVDVGEHSVSFSFLVFLSLFVLVKGEIHPLDGQLCPCNMYVYG